MRRVALWILSVRRRLLTVLAALSLLLCVVVLVMWWCAPRALELASCEDGSVWFTPAGLGGVYIPKSASPATLPAGTVLSDTRYEVLGVKIARWFLRDETYRNGAVVKTVLRATSYGVSIPYWLMAVMTLLVPALWLRAWHREQQARRRLADGLCLTCGYDLRESKECCPECGTVIPARS